MARESLEVALAGWGLSSSDLAFAKDHGEPALVLPWTRELLSDPLHVFAEGDAWRHAAADGGALRDKLRHVLDLGSGDPGPVRRTAKSLPGPDLSVLADPGLAEAVRAFYREAAGLVPGEDGLLRETAGKDLVVLAWLAGMYPVADDPAVRDELRQEGVSAMVVDEWLAYEDRLDRSPLAARWLAAAESVMRRERFDAGLALEDAAERLIERLHSVTNWPVSSVDVDTPLGPIRIGSLGADTHDRPGLLVVDPGGADTYAETAGVANGLRGQPVSVIVDVSGDDLYRSDRLAGPGTAWFGVSLVYDLAGDDTWRLGGGGLAHAVAGHARVEDRAGDDLYTAHACAQACAVLGTAVLEDLEGDDQYRLGAFGQAASGLFGAAVLIDRAGQDTYVAGGTHPDQERNPERFLSLAQGFSIGDRPDAGGGVAALIDLGGNDTYQADVYGQGVGYYYALGLLIDGGGHDTYRMHQYGQGAGIHLSGGLLADLEGNDVYTGYILAQGAAHDYAVGALVDRGGDDTYTTDHHGQGRALNNAVAWLIDEAGDDAYFARQPDQSQGIGNEGGFRDYGSLAFLLDLAGRDRYTAPAREGRLLLRRDYGVVFDREDGP